jgi:hypothetical protein
MNLLLLKGQLHYTIAIQGKKVSETPISTNKLGIVVCVLSKWAPGKRQDPI